MDKKNVVFLYYDGFAEFEIAIALLYLSNHNLIAAALENREYSSLEGQRFLVDKTIAQLDVDKIDLFLIPGGNPALLMDNLELNQFITRLDKRGSIIAGICGGADILVAMGFLRQKNCTGNALDPENPEKLKESYKDTYFKADELVVQDKNIITAQSEGYVLLAEILQESLK